MESILLENVLEKRQLNCNGEMLIIDGSNAGFGGDNNLLTYMFICVSCIYINNISDNSFRSLTKPLPPH